MYDPFAADVWATGIIFYRLRIDSHLPWEKATMRDLMYKLYINNTGDTLDLWASISDDVSSAEMNLLSRMLDSDAKTRITAEEILNHPAIKEYDGVCK
jgi:serine/threonine protein kinase